MHFVRACCFHAAVPRSVGGPTSGYDGCMCVIILFPSGATGGWSSAGTSGGDQPGLMSLSPHDPQMTGPIARGKCFLPRIGAARHTVSRLQIEQRRMGHKALCRPAPSSTRWASSIMMTGSPALVQSVVGTIRRNNRSAFNRARMARRFPCRRGGGVVKALTPSGSV